MTTKQALQLLTTLRPKTSYSLSHIDTCSSDYFSGHHLPVAQVLVDENSTYQNIKDGLLSYYATEHIEDLDTEAYERAVNELFEEVASVYAESLNEFKVYLKEKPFPVTTVPLILKGVGSMEEQDEWDLYMFFTVETLGEDDE